MLEVVGSFALNLGTGVFLSIMYGQSRRRSQVPIPCPLKTPWSFMWVPILLYYSAAVIYDFVTTSLRFWGLAGLGWATLALVVLLVCVVVKPQI